jgi:hypothetical protein
VLLGYTPGRTTMHSTLTDRPAGGPAFVADESRFRQTLGRYGAPLLGVALGVVFVCFGALDVAGVIPVGDLVAGAVPFPDAAPTLGVFEVVLGLVLMDQDRVGD